MRIAAVVCFVLQVLCTASAACAQSSSGAQSLFLDPSIRASGMGRASAAVFWGDDPNHWSNPALLGYHRGIRREWGKTQLVPGLADDVFFKTERWTLGGWGVGLAFAGRPDDSGELRLDYGTSIATDDEGNQVGEFSSWEEIHSWAVGLNLAEAAENVLRAAGRRAPPVSRYGDLSIGMAWKKTHVALVPASIAIDGLAGEGDVSTRDRGLVARLTPYNSLDFEGPSRMLDEYLRPLTSGIRLDLSYAQSVQNDEDKRITYVDEAQADPIYRVSRSGWAARVAMGWPGPIADAFDKERSGLVSRTLTPLLSFGRCSDRHRASAPDLDEPGERRRDGKIEESGWELTVANIWTIRRGHINDVEGTIVGDTRGWGVGFHLGDIAGYRYDEATVPQSIYLDEDVHRRGWEAWVDPIAIWRTLRSPRVAAAAAH